MFAVSSRDLITCLVVEENVVSGEVSSSLMVNVVNESVYRFHSVAVITSALHAEGPGFEPTFFVSVVEIWHFQRRRGFYRIVAFPGELVSIKHERVLCL